MVKEIVILKKNLDTIWRMYGLAVSYDQAGRRDEALKLREEVLALRRAKLGPDHPDTIRSMADLANSYARAGRRDEALKLGEEALARRKAKLGPDHPDTLRTMAALANSYDEAGLRDEALRLREEVLSLRKAKLGPDHPGTLQSMINLAISYAAAGQNERALAISEELLASQKAKLGRDHPAMLMARLSIVSSKVKLGRAADAADCRQAAEAFEKLNRTDANSLYNAACFRAVLAAAVRGAPRPPNPPSKPMKRRTGPCRGSRSLSRRASRMLPTCPTTTIWMPCATVPTSRGCSAICKDARAPRSDAARASLD
jgi:tetratricopeptide (TPR) repeat protein